MRTMTNSAVAEELRNQQRISDDELFRSEPYFMYLSEVLSSNLAGGKSHLARLCARKAVHLECEANEYSPVTAYTDGIRVHINTKNTIVWNMPNRWQRYTGDVGMIAHECGHIFFTDFTVWNPTLNHWKRGQYTGLYTSSAKVRDLTKLMNSEPRREYFLRVAQQVWNITEDVYIENRLYTVFAGVPALGLRQNALEIYRNAGTMNERLNRIAGNKTNIIDECLGLLLLKARGFDLKDQDCNANDPVYSKLTGFIQKAEPLLKALEWEPNAHRRSSKVLNICWLMIPFLKEIFQEAEEKSRQNQNKLTDNQSAADQQAGQSADNAQQDSNDPCKQDEESSKAGSTSCQTGAAPTESEEGQMPEVKNFSTALPKGDSAPVDSGRISEQEKQQSEQNKRIAENTSAESADAQAKKELDQYQFEQAEAMAGKKQLQKLNEEALDIQRKLCKQSDASVLYILNKPEKNNMQYSRLWDQVADNAAALERMLDRVLRERKEGGIQRNERKGKFDTKSYVHNMYGEKPLYFRSKKDPSGKPDVAFAIVIDESQSMETNCKIQKAAAAGILLDEVCRHIGVPAMIIGHDSYGGDDCRIDIYRDFDGISESEKYRFGSVESDGGNMDSGVIAFCAERLLKREEKQKVLFMISDGLPSAGVHANLNFFDDAREAVSNYTKKGISIFGIVIDDDYKKVHDIYGQRTIDARDLRLLPAVMGTLLRRLIISSIR